MDFIFYLTLLFFILIFGTLDNNIDFDFWARLTVGKSFFETNSLFNFDFQSYGTTHNFIDHEWGSSLVFYIIQHNFDDIGIYIFKSIIVFLTVFTITKIIRLENKNSKLHFLFFFFIIQSISYNIFTTIRCQTFSFLFFALYLYILKKASIENKYRILWCIPILNIIWQNLHGGFAIGLLLISIFIIGEYLNKKEVRPYIITFVVTLLTTLINPYGIEYVYFIVGALSLNRIYITEWQSAFFNDTYKYTLLKYKMFFCPVVIMFLYSIIKNIKSQGIISFYKKIDKTKYLLILVMLLISLKSIRFHVFFSYSVLALCYNDFYNIFNKKLPTIIDNLKEIILLILISISLFSHLNSYKFINTVRPSQYPIFCTEFIKINNLKGNVFTIFHTGSYVAYKLFPNNHVFMDGRYEEVYDNNLINNMANFMTAFDTDAIIKNYHTDIFIIDKSYKNVYLELKKHKDWYLAFESGKFALFLPIEYKNKKFKLPTNDLSYYNSTKYNTSINWLR